MPNTKPLSDFRSIDAASDRWPGEWLQLVPPGFPEKQFRGRENDWSRRHLRRYEPKLRQFQVHPEDIDKVNGTEVQYYWTEDPERTFFLVFTPMEFPELDDVRHEDQV